MTTKDDDLSGSNTPENKPNGKSSVTADQQKRLIALTSARPHHTFELRQFGITHPSGRVMELEALGYVFGKHRITTVDSAGFPHDGVALYELLSFPTKGQAQ
jgi:hypothetical protein